VHTQIPNESSSNILAYNMLYNSLVRARTLSSHPATYTKAFPTFSFIMRHVWTIFIFYTRTRNREINRITYYYDRKYGNK